MLRHVVTKVCQLRGQKKETKIGKGMKRVVWLVAVSALFLLGACGGNGSTNSKGAKLDGAGATFPFPFYQLAFKTYTDSTGVQVNYGAIGSGGGVRSLKDRVVDFAGSDAYLTDAEEASFEGGVVHIPTCLGGVAVAFNLPGVTDLKLTHEIIAGIYLGKITRWNDPKLQAVNEGVELPDLAITPVYRSDGSGTTFVFSHYMQEVNEDWRAALGEGKALNWQNGVAGKGNPGVAALIGGTPGAVGYVGSEYVFAQGLTSASVQNREGNFVKPTFETIAAAAEGSITEDLRMMVTNQPGAQTYPISCLTWIVIPKEQKYGKREESQAKASVELLRWMLSDGCQKLTKSVNYVPLPQPIRARAQELLDGVTYGGEALR